jgi:hypothetical protein
MIKEFGYKPQRLKKTFEVFLFSLISELILIIGMICDDIARNFALTPAGIIPLLF